MFENKAPRPGDPVEPGNAAPAVILSLADQPGEQHCLAADDRNRAATLRWDTVGVSVSAVGVFATELISCSTSRSTLPLALMRGATRNITPVLR